MGFFDLFSRKAGRQSDRLSGEKPEPSFSDPEYCKQVVTAYHEQTKHHLHRFATGPQEMDWDNQPDAFRRFEGAELRALPLGKAIGEVDHAEPGFDEALVEGRIESVSFDLRSLSRFLFDSMAISAWKEAGEARWALRVNPSSGNLHPTEAYLLAPAIAELNSEPAVHHYAPREHGLELRANLPNELWEQLASERPAGSFFVGLSSIHWREAWKYGERAFRYCQHDVGHAIAALSISAAALGWKVELVDDLSTSELAELLGVYKQIGPETETADCLLLVSPSGKTTDSSFSEGLSAEFRKLTWLGEPNDLSPDHVEWDAIDMTAQAACKSRTEQHVPWERSIPIAMAERACAPLRNVIRQRRSCQRLDQKTGMSSAEFFRIMASVMPSEGRVPFNALPWIPRVHLAVFVHRVEGLEPGLYFLQRDESIAESIRAACRPEFVWQRPANCPDELPLFMLWPKDLKSRAMQLSCNQDIASDGCFSLGMIAEFEQSIEQHGAHFYSRLFWETGVLGQLLYLEAESTGLRGTGIGCFFDDPVHQTLGLSGRTFQSLYHFTVGKASDDERLTTLPAYDERT